MLFKEKTVRGQSNIYIKCNWSLILQIASDDTKGEKLAKFLRFSLYNTEESDYPGF